MHRFTISGLPSPKSSPPKCPKFQNVQKCSAKFFESLGFYENDGKNGEKILHDLTHSWSAMEKLCEKQKAFTKCLDPASIKNCISVKEVESKEGYIYISPSAIYLTGNFICVVAKESKERSNFFQKNLHIFSLERSIRLLVATLLKYGRKWNVVL